MDKNRITVSAPVEVGRGPGHHWFPSLHPLHRNSMLCEVIITADKAQGEWPAKLYLTRDQGRSWHLAGSIDSYGPASLALDADRLLLMPYELWPIDPADRRSARAKGTLVRVTGAGAICTERTEIRFLGFPCRLQRYNETEVLLCTNGNILSLGNGRLLMTIYGSYEYNRREMPYTCMAVQSTDGGFTWRYVSDVASGVQVPAGREGPNESNSARLPDGRIVCVYRVGSAKDQRYHYGVSRDGGATWSAPVPLPAQWSVEPQLVCLESGALVLSGGRPGLWVWVCPDGRLDHWQAVNIAAHHNRHMRDRAWHYPENCVFGSTAAWESAATTSYTGLKAIGPDELMLAYDRLAHGWYGAPGPLGDRDAVFSVRVKVEGAA